jgi:hypothetical protein
VTKTDHHAQTQRSIRKDLTAQARYRSAQAQERKIRLSEQAYYAAIARAHAHANSFCASIVKRLDAGGRVTTGQAATLLKIEEERGNGVDKAKASRRALEANRPQNALEQRIALYDGDNAELQAFAARCLVGECLTDSECGRASYLERLEAVAEAA